MKIRVVAIGAAVAVLVSCTIRQQVKPVSDLAGKEICVIENPAVRSTFVEAYRRSLGARGFTVRMLPSGSSVADCPVSSTYNARWSWDLALYMSYAELVVYGNGMTIGEAKYDSTGGGGNLNKFIDAEKKVDELVGQLITPGRKF